MFQRRGCRIPFFLNVVVDEQEVFEVMIIMYMRSLK